jgi:hypothetical protein
MGVKQGLPWTAAEDEIMRREYARTPVQQLAARLERTIHSVRKRAQALRLQTWRHWTEADRDTLRAKWGKVRTRELARELGRPPGAVKQQATKLGLDSGRCYTAEDLALLRELYQTHTAAQIAAQIHGSPRSALAIYRMAYKLGLAKQPHHSPEVYADVRRLHGEGLPDRVIATRLGLRHDQVKDIRGVRLKLPVNPDAEGKRQGVQKQFTTLGIRTAGELRSLAYRRYAVENGWPQDLRPREVQILNVLAERGVPMTRLELSGAIGMRTDRIGCNNSPALLTGNGPGGTYTASLARRGFLRRLKRGFTVSDRGRGRSLDLYVLGPAALAILEERSCQQQNVTETAAAPSA